MNLFGEGVRLDVRSQHLKLDGTVRYEGDGLAYWCNQDIFQQTFLVFQNIGKPAGGWLS